MAVSHDPAATQRSHLSGESIGLPQVLFQAITHMGPAAAVAFSLLIGFTFAGPAMPLSIIITLVVVLLIANSVGQMARHVPAAGGVYAYASHSVGTSIGFLVGWCDVLLELIVPPGISLVLGIVMQSAFQSAGINAPWWIWTLMLLLLSAGLNYRGIRLATNAGVIFGIFELLVFLALAVFMIVKGGSANTVQVFNPAHALQGTWSGVFKGVVFSILAFQGFECAAPLGEEARNPRKTIVQATLLSALIIGLFYFVCSYGAVVGWGFGRMQSYATNANPWQVLAQRFWGIGWLVVLLALVNRALGNANGGVTAASRLTFAMGRVGALPRVFAHTHHRFRTPDVAILSQLVFGIVVTLALGLSLGAYPAFEVVGTVLTVLVILVYITVCCGSVAYYLGKRRAEFNLVLHAIFPILGAVILLAPLYFEFVPAPPAPIQEANWFAVGWVVVGIGLLVFLARTRPSALRDASKIFIQGDAPVPEDA
ncbi:MAG: APC family permease [Candidatus Dormiibacterota bacterium]